LALAALATRAWAQTAVWHDSEKLWRHAISVTKYNYLAHENLGQYLWSKQRVAEAIPHYQQALAISPNVEIHNRVGLWLIQHGQPSEAVAHWKKALEVDPADLNAQSNLAWVFATCPERSMRDGARAVQFAENVLARSATRTPILLRTLAAAYAEAGRYTEAIAAAREAAELANGQGERAFADELEALARDFRLEIPLRDPSLADVRPATIP
jgi:tetratricopeptide (TPR) repeat protein